MKQVIVPFEGYPESSEEMEARFNAGVNVKDHWKHKVWDHIPDWKTLTLIAAAARHYYGCTRKQELALQHDDGTYSYEAVYGCEGDGKYSLRQWDGTVALSVYF